jgi:hypothetical protein
MAVDELLRRGGECEAAGDLAGAEQAYREADELHDAEGADPPRRDRQTEQR